MSHGPELKTLPMNGSTEPGPHRVWRQGEIITTGNAVFKVEGLLAQGGMGMVYKVLDLSSNRPMVIKSPLAGTADDEQIKRLFINEAEEWIQISIHPNIVRAYDVFDFEWLPRILAEYVTGIAGCRHNERPLPNSLPSSTCWYGFATRCNSPTREVWYIETEAHEYPVDQRRYPKVTDFGLVKRLDEKEDPAGASGTPEYMAPEQFEGITEKSVDIYAFGVILFELFSGRKPYHFPNAHPDARFAIYARAHQESDPLDLQELAPSVTSPLVDLTMSCLAKDPAERPVDFSKHSSRP